MEIRKFLCQKIGLPKGYLAMKYYLSATKTVATGGYFRNIGLHRPTSIQIFTDPISHHIRETLRSIFYENYWS